MMIVDRLRYAAAFPVYVVAFLFQEIGDFFAWVAMQISGHDKFEPSHVHQRTSHMISAGVLMSAILLLPVFYAALRSAPPTAPTRLEIVRPMKNEEFTKVEPERIPILIPAVKIAACIFAEKAVRHHVSPEPVRLPSCGGHATITVSDDLVDVTVSGTAIINKIEQEFTVTMQHNPPSVTEDGFIITGIEIH